MKTLRIAEIFDSIQGEGHWTGVPCTFVRLQGCNLRCAFCDSRSTWDLDGGTEMTIHDIVKKVPPTMKHVVLTGGEPALQKNVVALAAALIWANFYVHIETNGMHYDILRALKAMSNVWITISPKFPMLSSSVLLLADEIKWVIESEQDLWTVDRVFEELACMIEDFPPTFFLQPVSQDPEATALCVKHVIENAHREYQLSIQVHRYIGVK